MRRFSKLVRVDTKLWQSLDIATNNKSSLSSLADQRRCINIFAFVIIGPNSQYESNIPEIRDRTTRLRSDSFLIMFIL